MILNKQAFRGGIDSIEKIRFLIRDKIRLNFCANHPTLASKSSYFMPEKRILLRHLNEESMEHIMVEKLSELTVLTEEEKKAIVDSFAQVLKPKGTHLLREGQNILFLDIHFHLVNEHCRAVWLIDKYPAL